MALGAAGVPSTALALVAALVALGSAGTKATAPLHDALLALPFANSDVTLASHNYSMRAVSSIYLESETPLKARWAWADGRITPFNTHAYLFVKNATANQTTVSSSPPSTVRPEVTGARGLV